MHSWDGTKGCMHARSITKFLGQGGTRGGHLETQFYAVLKSEMENLSDSVRIIKRLMSLRVVTLARLA